jgi:hypothetical protein
MSEPELDRLIVSAQKRNIKEGITGLLIYDQGRFLQWLEGPTEGVGRVWQSISQDRRHDVISVLGESSLPVRCFGSSAMARGKRRAEIGGHARRPAEVGLPSELIEALYRSPHAAPSVLAALAPRPQNPALRRAKLVSVPSDPGKMSLRGLINEVIVPELVTRHAKSLLVPIVIDTRTGELARLLLAADPDEAFALIDLLRADGRSLTQLCSGLLEPAGRALGDLWCRTTAPNSRRPWAWAICNGRCGGSVARPWSPMRSRRLCRCRTPCWWCQRRASPTCSAA